MADPYLPTHKSHVSIQETFRAVFAGALHPAVEALSILENWSGPSVENPFAAWWVPLGAETQLLKNLDRYYSL
jgi:hypothetical protein